MPTVFVVGSDIGSDNGNDDGCTSQRPAIASETRRGEARRGEGEGVQGVAGALGASGEARGACGGRSAVGLIAGWKRVRGEHAHTASQKI